MHSSLPKNFRATLPSLSCWTLLSFLMCFGVQVHAEPLPINTDEVVKTAGVDLSAKKYDEGLSVLAPALQAHPHDPDLLILKGALLTKKNDFDGARICFNQVLQVAPDSFPAKYNLGALLALEHKWDAAIEYYRQLLFEQQNNELVEYKLLLLLLHQDSNPELQAKLFDTDLPTNTPAWYYAKAARCYKAGNTKEAEKYLEVARNIYGDQTSIFQDELDEVGLNQIQKK